MATAEDVAAHGRADSPAHQVMPATAPARRARLERIMLEWLGRRRSQTRPHADKLTTRPFRNTVTMRPFSFSERIRAIRAFACSICSRLASVRTDIYPMGLPSSVRGVTFAMTQ